MNTSGHLNVTLANYNFEILPTGGVGMYIDDTLPYKVIEKTANEGFVGCMVRNSAPQKTQCYM